MLGVDQQETPEKFPEHTFGIVHDKARSYFIKAENEEEKLEWVKVFQLCRACIKGTKTQESISNINIYIYVYNIYKPHRRTLLDLKRKAIAKCFRAN